MSGAELRWQVIWGAALPSDADRGKALASTPEMMGKFISVF